MKLKTLLAAILFSLATCLSFATSEILNKEVTGFEWLQMSAGDRRDYVEVSMAILYKNGIPLNYSLFEYFNAIEQKLLRDNGYYGTSVTNILAAVVYETEPKAREALDRARAKPAIQKIEMH